MAAVELTQDNFRKRHQRQRYGDRGFLGAVVRPLPFFAPVYEEVSEKYPDVVFAKVNTEVEQGIAASFQIRSIPTLMVFREKVIIYSEAGALPASGLEQLVEQAQSLDMADVHKQIAEQEAAGV